MVLRRGPTAIEELDILEKTEDHSRDATVASTQLMPANKHRTAAWIVNDSDALMYLAFGRDAVVGRGIRLNALGGALEINKTCLYKGTINIIHDSTGNKSYTALELTSRYD